MKKYRILFGYGSEEMQFHEKEFTTVSEAVKYVVGQGSNGRPFRIVQIIEWEAVERL